MCITFAGNKKGTKALVYDTFVSACLTPGGLIHTVLFFEMTSLVVKIQDSI